MSPGSHCEACGDCTPAPWQALLFRQETCAPPPVKEAAWQIWHDLKPELPGARFAVAPWAAADAHTGSSWWQAAVKQEVFEIPPARSSPWHAVHALTSDTAKPGWVESQSTGWVPPPGPGVKRKVMSLLLFEHPPRKRTAQTTQKSRRKARRWFPVRMPDVPLPFSDRILVLPSTGLIPYYLITVAQGVVEAPASRGGRRRRMIPASGLPVVTEAAL